MAAKARPGRWKSIASAGKFCPTRHVVLPPYGRISLTFLPKGRIHHLRRLHHLPARRSEGPLRRRLRLLPRLEILPRAGQVRDPDARGLVGPGVEGEVGVGPREARSRAVCGFPTVRDEGL